MNQDTIRNIIITGMVAGASVLPVTMYGLFNPDSWTYAVTKFVFSLN